MSLQYCGLSVQHPWEVRTQADPGQSCLKHLGASVGEHGEAISLVLGETVPPLIQDRLLAEAVSQVIAFAVRW
ncbi:hypothetical protein [Candidatus Nitrospira salsa]